LRRRSICGQQRVISVFYVTEKAQKARERNVVSYKLSPYGLNLPCGMNMDEEKVGKVCDALNAIIDNRGKREQRI